MATINLKSLFKEELRRKPSGHFCGTNTVLLKVNEREREKKRNPTKKNMALSHHRSNHFLTSPCSSSSNGRLLFHKVSNECGQLCSYGGCTVSEAAGVSAAGGRAAFDSYCGELEWQSKAFRRVCLPFLCRDPSEPGSPVPRGNGPIQLICHKLTGLLWNVC